MKLKLIGKKSEVSDVITFVWQPEQPVSWQAGQYIQYILPHEADDRGEKRWFTIASAPYEGKLQITTRFAVRSSSFKDHLRGLEVGATVEAGEPEGDFVITDPDQEFIFVAGGIGVTPFHSMLKQAAYEGRKLKVELLYGNRNEESSVFLGEFKEYAIQNPSLTIHNILEPDRITADTIKAIDGFQSKHVYVSGPEPMVEAFEKTLDGIGIPKDQQHFDYFPGYAWEPAK